MNEIFCIGGPLNNQLLKFSGDDIFGYFNFKGYRYHKVHSLPTGIPVYSIYKYSFEHFVLPSMMPINKVGIIVYDDFTFSKEIR